jgi:5'-methylthioadenosine phosphorylase
MATDYDCWRAGHEDVTVDAILAVMHANVGNARRLIQAAVPRLAAARGCSCGSALAHALMTAPEQIPAPTRARLALLLDKYLPRS